MKITFERASIQHNDTIFSWLAEPHIIEFWDNSQEHKDDILNFMEGRKEPSSYCDGLYTYWIGFIDNNPYCLVMTLKEKHEYDLPKLKKIHLSKFGHTYSIEYMIGNKNYFNKGLGAKTIEIFVNFVRENYDKDADTFFIDPDVSNPRARHVYEKAGFKYIDDFIMEGNGVFAGRKTHFLVKKLLEIS